MCMDSCTVCSQVGAALRQLHAFLHRVDKSQTWGGLAMVQLKQMTQQDKDEGTVLWVCASCLAGAPPGGNSPFSHAHSLGMDESDYVPRAEYDRVVNMCANLKKQVRLRLMRQPCGSVYAGASRVGLAVLSLHAL